jgi:hypothetical protein
MNKSEIIALFNGFGCAITQDDIWQVQSATVIKHKALERLAASARIAFDPPTIIRANADEAVILATGRLNDRVEWSIGEALVNVNYRVSGKQAAYVYAMAEKRAKDRVILKLAGLHGLYSEDEADEFKEQPRATSTAQMSEDLTHAMDGLDLCETQGDVTDWMDDFAIRIGTNHPDFQAIRAYAAKRFKALPKSMEKAA